MIRAIVLLLILAALAVLAVQNLSTSVALVILSSRTGEIPFGLLLVGAVGVGALISLILYGLLSLLRRSPESKYQPLGRRVPYPESPRDAAQPVSSSPYQPEAPYGSAAFVSEPAAVPQDSTPDPSATKYSDMPPEAAYRPSPLPQPAPEKKRAPLAVIQTAIEAVAMTGVKPEQRRSERAGMKAVALLMADKSAACLTLSDLIVAGAMPLS